MKKILLFIFGLLILPVCFSATIELNSGEKIEGQIIERTDEYIKVDYFGVPINYSFDEIRSIDGQSLDGKPVSAQFLSSNLSQGNLIVNEQFGFTFRVPSDWYELLVQPGAYSFSSEPDIKKGVVPRMLMVTIDSPNNFGGADSAYDYARKVEQDVESKDRNFYRIIELAKPVKVNGIDSATLIYAKSVNSNDGNTMMMVAHNFYFFKNAIVVIMFTDGNNSFDANLSKMKPYMESFQYMADQDVLPKLYEKAKEEYDFNPVLSEEYNVIKDKIAKSIEDIKTFKSQLTVTSYPDGAEKDYPGTLMDITYVSPDSFEADTVVYESAQGGPSDTWRVAGKDMYIKIGFWMPFSFDQLKGSTEQDSAAFDEIAKSRQEYYKMFLLEDRLSILDAAEDVSLAKEGDYSMLKFSVSADKMNSLQHDEISKSGYKIAGDTQMNVLVYNPDNTIRYIYSKCKAESPNGELVNFETEQYYYGYNIPYTLGKPLSIVKTENGA